MSGWQLAQINIGTMVAPKGDPMVAEFYAALDAINAIADASPGFVWRLQDEAGNATDIQATPDPKLLVNISVWADLDSLSAFVYRSSHAGIMRQRRQWFVPFDGAFQALWWVPAGHRPDVMEGLARLWLLDRYGPSQQAFGFKTAFAPPEGASHG
ncbi:hypothetical protein CAP39_13865 [Sphingomonas sp. IBVSS1]|nr:hypothetical protein CAP39_13865 [Sphingomonas sp. IBVSS1]